MRCSNCGQYSTHNKRQCPIQALENDHDTHTSVEERSPHYSSSADERSTTHNPFEEESATAHILHIPRPVTDDEQYCIAAEQNLPAESARDTGTNEVCIPRTDSIHCFQRHGQRQADLAQAAHRGKIGRSWGTIISHETCEGQRWYWIRWDSADDQTDNLARHTRAELCKAGERRWIVRYCRYHNLLEE